MAKRIYSKNDIDKLKESGLQVLRLQPGDALTPLARDTALELGIKVLNGEAVAAASTSSSTGGTMASEQEIQEIVKAGERT